MYPYNNNQNSDRNEYYTPLVPQQRTPDENGYYHFSPAPRTDNTNRSSGGTNPPGKKGRKAAKIAATAMAMVVMSAAAGGGAAWYVVNNAGVATESSTSGTVLQTAVADKITTGEGSVAAVAQAASNSVVEIDTKTRQQNFFMGSSLVEGAGSGVVISEDGYIVTNHHVVGSVDSIVVRFNDGTEYNAILIGTDQQTDLAVLKIEATGLSAITFADSDQIQVGDLAVAIGNPLGELGGTVTSGIISATGREVSINGDSMTLLQTSAAINPGNSGGGLFDSNGHLIGVVNAKSAGVEVEGLGFAIPSNTVKQVVADIIDNGYVSGRPEMGIQVIEVNDAMTAQMMGVRKAGVYVADPGDNEGLEAGDRFVFIEGESIDSSSDVTSALKKYQVGQTINITVERNGMAVETQVTLREKVPVTQAEPEVDDEI